MGRLSSLARARVPVRRGCLWRKRIQLAWEMKPDAALGHERLIRGLEIVGALSDRDRDLIRSLPLHIKTAAEGQDVVRQGSRPMESCLLIQGWLYRYKQLVNGRRAILSFHMPGDIPDLQSLHLTTMDHSIGALVRSTVAFMRHEDLRNLCRQSEQALHVLWRRTLIDAAMHREWLASATQQSAEERMAHLFCEVFYRMRALGLADEAGFEFPATQVELGDALGMSAVHVNRVLQRLRRDGFISSQGQHHGIASWARLQELAAYDPTYLHMSPGEGP